MKLAVLIVVDLALMYITVAVALALIWSGVWVAVLVGLAYVAFVVFLIRDGMRLSNGLGRRRSLYRIARNLAILHVVVLPVVLASYAM